MSDNEVFVAWLKGHLRGEVHEVIPERVDQQAVSWNRKVTNNSNFDIAAPEMLSSFDGAIYERSGIVQCHDRKRWASRLDCIWWSPRYWPIQRYHTIAVTMLTLIVGKHTT